MTLGTTLVRLDEDGITLLPGRLQQWRGARPDAVPFADIASLEMTEPRGPRRGTFAITRHGGAVVSVGFPSSRLKAMRRLYAEAWRRVRGARPGGPSSAT